MGGVRASNTCSVLAHSLLAHSLKVGANGSLYGVRVGYVQGQGKGLGAVPTLGDILCRGHAFAPGSSKLAVGSWSVLYLCPEFVSVLMRVVVVSHSFFVSVAGGEGCPDAGIGALLQRVPGPSLCRESQSVDTSSC